MSTLRPCRAKVLTADKKGFQELDGCLFHAWGHDLIKVGEITNGFTYGIVETVTGAVVRCKPEDIHFLDREVPL